MPPAFDPCSRSAYRAWTAIPIRFSDQDVMGHVNNTIIASYLEHARCEHLLPRVISSAAPDLNFVLARIVIDYRREILYPGTVEVGIRIARLGQKSFVIAGGVFVGDAAHATSEATMVFFNTQTRRSTLPPERVKALLHELV